MTLTRFLLLSRPHFWLYEFGTFFLGVIIATSSVDEVWSVEVLLWGFYFFLPANLLIYGINDVFDYETDSRNPKKVAYESILPKESHKTVLLLVSLTSVPFLFFTTGFTFTQIASLGLFWFFAVFYSAPPIRAKARPFIDSFFSAGHYVTTGVFGYFLISPNAAIPWLGILAGMAWAIAMHVYSAVPDIAADREADLETTATWLGARKAFWYCIFLYTTAAILAVFLIGPLAALILVPYIMLLFRSFGKTVVELLAIYRYFPYLNATIGMILTFVAFYQNGWL